MVMIDGLINPGGLNSILGYAKNTSEHSDCNAICNYIIENTVKEKKKKVKLSL
jgi:hypothetical protein